MNHYDLLRCECTDRPLMARLLREQRRAHHRGIVRAIVIIGLTLGGWSVIYAMYRILSWFMSR